MTQGSTARLFSRLAPLLLAGTMIVAGSQIARAGFNEAGENSFFMPGPGEMVGSPEQAPAAADQATQPAQQATPVRHARMHRPAMARMKTRDHTMQASAAHAVVKHRVMHASHTQTEPNLS